MPKSGTATRPAPRAEPYQTISPRRALRPSNSPNGVWASKVVRQAANPACNAPQSMTDDSNVTGPTSRITCIDRVSDTVRRVFVYERYRSYLSSDDPSWSPNLPATVATCEKLGCDTGRDIVRQPDSSSTILDTRCAVASPPQAWTSRLDGGFGLQSSYEGIPGTYRMPSVYRINNQYYRAPNETYSAPRTTYLPLSALTAAPYDVEPYDCLAGQTNPVTAKRVQCNLGLRSDCVVPSPSATYSVVGTTSATFGALSTAAVFFTPVPTATIAASANGAVVSGLAAGLAATGSLLMLGAASYGAARLIKYLRKEPFQSSSPTFDDAQRYTTLRDVEVGCEKVASEPIYDTVDAVKDAT